MIREFELGWPPKSKTLDRSKLWAYTAFPLRYSFSVVETVGADPVICPNACSAIAYNSGADSRAESPRTEVFGKNKLPSRLQEKEN